MLIFEEEEAPFTFLLDACVDRDFCVEAVGLAFVFDMILETEDIGLSRGEEEGNFRAFRIGFGGWCLIPRRGGGL